MIEIKNLKKVFDDNVVLEDFNLTINKGEIIAIIGPSGSGKSTFLRCLNLLEIPSFGQVRIDDVFYDASKLIKKDYTKIRQKTAMVFQDYCLFANKNVIDNIALALIVVRKISKQEAYQKANELLDKVGLLDKKDAKVSQLSGGQKQRVAIARALVLNPYLLLFDEPTSALDPELVNEVLSVIKDIAKSKITSIIVTHEIAFAREVADRIIFMDAGKIIEQNTAKELVDNPQEKRTKQFLNKINHC